MHQSAQIVRARPTRLRAGLGAAVVLVLVGLSIAIIAGAVGSHGVSRSAAQPAATERAPGHPLNVASGDSAATGITIYVHVYGAVARPGLYLLTDGDRLVDLMAVAGGFAPTADQSRVNLARLLVDGEQVEVLELGDPAGAGAGAGSSASSKVSINSADSNALQSLPGVGPATAKQIIDWRTKNGRFTVLEDLLSVPGIGEKTLEQLRDLITI